MQHHCVETSFDESSINSFVILSGIERSIKEKIEKVGIPLKDWDIQINYGIKTGFNEAFIIDGKTKDELISKSPKNAEIIRPILRGRDIKRYGYEFADKWLICTHNGTEHSPAINIDDYPDIKGYLDQYITQLSKRQDKGVTPYNLRSCAYMDDFSKQKVMWKIIGCNLNFFYDTEGFYCNNAVNIMTGKESVLLQFIGLMNSNLFEWYLKLTTTAEVQGGGIQMYSTALELLPLKLDFEDSFTKQILKRIAEDVSDVYINQIIYQLYELNDEEIKFIESQ